MSSKYAVILAAGQGTRMKSKLYKVLHPVCGKPMVDHVLTQIEKNDMDQIVTVIGHGAEMVKKTLKERTNYVVQSEQLGTGHAVMQAERLLGDKDGITLIACGDTPLFTAETFSELFQYHQSKGAVATVLTAHTAAPFGYGRIIRNDLGIVEKIVEQKDATKEDENTKMITYGPSIHGKLVAEFPGYFDDVLFAYVDISGKYHITTKPKGRWPAKTRLGAGKDQENPYARDFFKNAPRFS